MLWGSLRIFYTHLARLPFSRPPSPSSSASRGPQPHGHGEDASLRRAVLERLLETRQFSLSLSEGAADRASIRNNVLAVLRYVSCMGRG